MDTVQTAISKGDALQKDVGDRSACKDAPLQSATTACAVDNKVDDLKPACDKAIISSEKVAGFHIAAPPDCENSDDLLEKIEEVVKDDVSNGDVQIDAAIAESSEQDFIKQLEEAEAEAKAPVIGGAVGADDNKGDCVVESVSSSDERERAGNLVEADNADETDRVHVADNVVDSTNTELNKTAKECLDEKTSEDQNEVELISNEANSASVSKAGCTEPEKDCMQNECESSESSAKDSRDVVTNKNQENCQVAEHSASVSERSERTPAEIPSILVSSSEGSDAEAEPETSARSAKIESQGLADIKEDSCDVMQEVTSNDLSVKKTSSTINPPSECLSSKEVLVEQGTSAPEKSVEKTSAADSKTCETEPMSVEQSPATAVETMEVDEEERMDVDIVEIISDEEMPPEPKHLNEVKEKIIVSKSDKVSSSFDVVEEQLKSFETAEVSTSANVQLNIHTKDPKLETKNVISSKSPKKPEVLPLASTTEDPKDANSQLSSDSSVGKDQTTPIVPQEEARKSSTTEGKVAKPSEITNERAKSDEVASGTAQSNPVVADSSTKPENKFLTNIIKDGGSGTSLENSPVAVPSANVFNSTPIQKQFDISSENVSKISEAHDDVNRTTEEATPPSSKTDEETGELGTIYRATKIINSQCNGTSEDDEIPTTTVKTLSSKPLEIIPTDLHSKTDDMCPRSHPYEINVWYDEHDIRFLSIEKLETKKPANINLDTSSAAESEKLSSNGSVFSVPQFTLPSRTLDILSGSSSSSKTSDGKSNYQHIKREKHVVEGVVELCSFMINHFTQMKSKFEPPSTPTSGNVSVTTKDETTTPRLKGRGSSKKQSLQEQPVSSEMEEIETPTKNADKRPLKRALNKTQSEDEDESKAKQAKQGKSQSANKHQETLAKSAAENSLYCVLAKWVDKKYYAGRVTEEKAGNKFVVLFEDGASKILPKDSIVFGEEDMLPLKDHSVYALLDDDYELGTVKLVEKCDDKVIYTVDIDGKSIQVSASDIYLTDQQAKTIQNRRDALNSPPALSKSVADSPTERLTPGTSSRSTRKRPATSPITPEAGFSGNTSKRAGRKSKRLRAEIRLSGSTDVSDGPETVAPDSPDSTLEAIEGVQPEVQKTPRESEINRLMMISDFTKMRLTGSFEDLIGPLPMSNTIFKNKCFLLTCTVTQKLPPFGAAGDSISTSHLNLKCDFSNIPFLKLHIKRQIESGGGKVYDHFEEVPQSKYKQCKLIASQPCTTAKYVQCLAADIPAISNEWILDCCKTDQLIHAKNYFLPSGWSVIHKKYMKWAPGKSADCRQSKKPFAKTKILIASEHGDFVTFWSRVCKLAGATVGYIKTLCDVTPTTIGYMVTEQDFPFIIKSKAEHYGIPIVSTFWIVQSLILGEVCDPNAHAKLTQFGHDDEL